ncbi:MAG TPA: hypothetical protein VHQ03_08960 [Candidatus Dormibacteraeota bacterium]|nr:hypothetical protein [Candidatus Dormibacteraeota bacterium]
MTVALRFASLLLWISAVGLGVPCLMAIRSLAAGRGIPNVFGFPAYGGGNFERRGMKTSIPLLIAFLLVLLLEALAGGLLWTGHLAGGILVLILLPLAAVFWWGFDLPYPPMVAGVRTALILLGWQSLR